jgi:hypothetical protein
MSPYCFKHVKLQISNETPVLPDALADIDRYKCSHQIEHVIRCIQEATTSTTLNGARKTQYKDNYNLFNIT